MTLFDGNDAVAEVPDKLMNHHVQHIPTTMTNFAGVWVAAAININNSTLSMREAGRYYATPVQRLYAPALPPSSIQCRLIRCC